MLEADGLGFLPRPGEPESNLIAGMAAPRAPEAPQAAIPGIAPAAMPDTSVPGPVALQSPNPWVYDFDPGTGVARAQFVGEVTFTSGGAAGSVTSWNTRTGAVVMTTADITGAGGAPIASPAFTGASSFSSTLAVTGALTPTGGIVGVNGASNAAAGNIGEYVTASLAQGSAVNLPGGTATNLTSISLTAGDWDVFGVVSATFTT